MILTKPEILKEIKEGNIKITPYDKKSVGPASIDLTLASQIRIFEEGDQVIKGKVDYKKVTKIRNIKNGYTLKPGELVMGITKERVNLPSNICGWLNSRSRYARIGLMSHVTAPFICPGVNNKQVLEIYNAGPKSIRLEPGSKICQLVFQECKGNATYKGKFKDQKI